jgi:hypothetical protein
LAECSGAISHTRQPRGVGECHIHSTNLDIPSIS